MLNFHVSFSRQRGGCWRYVRFHLRLRPGDWEYGNKDYKAGVYVLYKMYCLGPFGVQWG